jgi:hypothetical protein
MKAIARHQRDQTASRVKIVAVAAVTEIVIATHGAVRRQFKSPGWSA